MKNNRYNGGAVLLFAIMLIVSLNSCESFVEDGYRVDYDISNMELKVEVFSSELAELGDTLTYLATGDTIVYVIQANSLYDIKSCVVQSTNDGAAGSGFDVSDSDFDDPFADHSYGTMKKNVRSFRVKYNYIMPKNISNSRITFSAIDAEGKATLQRTAVLVPSIKKYSGISLYAKDNLNNDAFSTSDGVVYEDIKTNYSIFSGVSIDVQEKIDMIFFYNTQSQKAVIASPASSSVALELDIENNNLFKKLNISTDAFNSLTASSLFEITQNDSIFYTGSPAISGIKVGDIIGFITDLNGIEPLKTGIIKINALHPTSISRYKGTSYVMEFDIVTQVKNQ